MDDLDLLKVKDKNNLYRDPISKGIINTDETGYNQYVESYRRKYNEMQKMKSLEDEIHNMKSDLVEIKNLLKNLTNGS